MKRVLITGIGVLSPIGNTTEEFWNNIRAGKSGVTKVERFDISRFNSQIAATVKGFDASQFMDRREARRADLVQQYAVAASEMALQDSGADVDSFDKTRIGVVFGSGIGGIGTFEKQVRTLDSKGPGKVSPFFIPMMIIDMTAGLISLRYGFKGPNYSTVSACASSAHAIADAMRLVQRGDCDMVVTGGAEAAITEIAYAGFCSARALSTRNDDPETASRPFDVDRDGFVMGEGSAVLILESEESAKARRAKKIYAEMLGAGMTADAYHITAPEPHGEGAARAMAAAIVDAGISADQVDYINTHGTSTPLGDIAETRAIKQVFQDRVSEIAINSTKSMIGHMLGAAGAIEAAASALALKESYVHRTMNMFNQDPECDLDYTTDAGREEDIHLAVSNSFGFGGHNISLVLGKYNDSNS